jgi:UDP-2,3-diacylglucosamine hydrolase
VILRVCGTPVESALDDARTTTILLSDAHVPIAGGPVVADLGRVLARAREQARETRVIVLGDLFDAYVGGRQDRVGATAEVVSSFRDAVAAGVSVTLLHGNRDFLLGRHFERATGARVVAGGLAARLLGRRALLLHGDELCWNDRPYQRAKVRLRHPLTKLLVRSLPLWASLRLSGAARQRSSMVIGSGDQERFAPVAAAVREAYAPGHELLVFGHIHLPARGWFASGQEYCVLPAFDRAGEHLVADARGLRYVDRDGRDRPDYPPRAFS